MMRSISSIATPLKKLLKTASPSAVRYLSSAAVCRAPSLELSGVYPPIPTPFNEREDIAWDELSNNLEKWDKFSFKGFVVQGSNGEYVFLSHEERIKMVEFVRNHTPKNKLILAGSGCEGTRETLRLTTAMANVGADAALVVTPSFFKARMNSQAMMKHFTTIADSSPIPIILYNVPANTGVEFPMDAILKLAKHPNIIGLKDSSGNITNMGSIIHDTADEEFQLLAGSASFLLPSLQLGAVGGICALANVLGGECCHLYDLIQQNKLEEAVEYQLKLISPNQAVTRKYAVPALKYAMEKYGYFGGECRSPITMLNEVEKIDVEKCFQHFPPT